MGDFNMSLFMVVPELRSRGIQATLVSWFPWRTEETDETMVDSCGIFILVPADVTPSLHHDIFRDDTWIHLPAFPKNAGPGKTIQTYLPKKGDAMTKIKGSLEPLPMSIQEGDESAEDASAVAGQTAPTAVAGRVKDGLTIKGKTLQTSFWMYKGENHKGSHFPLACWTNNTGRRGEDADCRRQDRNRAKKKWPRPQ